MKDKKHLFKIYYTILICLFIFPQPLYSYLDPGTFSYLLSILVAALVGTLFYIKAICIKIKLFIKKILKLKKGEESNL